MIAPPRPRTASPRRKAAKQCERLADDLVRSWRRRDQATLELEQHVVAPERAVYLRTRIKDLLQEGAELEAAMSVAAERWAALVGEEERRTPKETTRQGHLFQVLA